MSNRDKRHKSVAVLPQTSPIPAVAQATAFDPKAVDTSGVTMVAPNTTTDINFSGPLSFGNEALSSAAETINALRLELVSKDATISMLTEEIERLKANADRLIEWKDEQAPKIDGIAVEESAGSMGPVNCTDLGEQLRAILMCKGLLPNAHTPWRNLYEWKRQDYCDAVIEFAALLGVKL